MFEIARTVVFSSEGEFQTEPDGPITSSPIPPCLSNLSPDALQRSRYRLTDNIRVERSIFRMRAAANRPPTDKSVIQKVSIYGVATNE